MTFMKSFITGATGFVGKNLAKRLNDEGGDVFYLSRGKKLEFGHLIKAENLYDKEFWSMAIGDCDSVIHCMARVHVLKETSSEPYKEFRKLNVEATGELAKACLDSNVKKFIFLSTVGVYGNNGINISEDSPLRPNGDYAKTKIEAEELLREIFRDSEIELVILRPPLIYGVDAPGNYRSLEKAISKKIPLPLGGINNKRSFLFIENLTWTIKEFLKTSKPVSGTYNVTDLEVVSTSFFLRNISKHFSLSFIIYVPVFLLKLLGRVTGKLRAVKKLTDDLTFNNSKIVNLLGSSNLLKMETAISKMYQKN